MSPYGLNGAIGYIARIFNKLFVFSWKAYVWPFTYTQKLKMFKKNEMVKMRL